MIPLATDVSWQLSPLTYFGCPRRNDTPKLGTALERWVSTGSGGLDWFGINGEYFPPVLKDSQIELSMWIAGRYGFGYVDVWDYLGIMETGLFLRNGEIDTQIGSWSATSMSDDELVRLFAGPGTGYPIPSLATGGLLTPKLRIGGTSGRIVETDPRCYTPERSW